VLTAAPGGGTSGVLTNACPGGGSMTLTFSATPPAATSNTITTSARMDFSDCRSQSVTINGDPYLMMSSEYAFSPPTGSPTVTATNRMTGGLRFDAGGVQGRAQYDCTQTMTMQIGSGGTPTPSAITSTGTITWEQPLGTVTTRPCSG